jgi:DNA-binding protein H-NS
MGLADRLKDLRTKATDATVERSDKIHEAVEKVAATADQRTGGKYREHIQKAGAKADSLVDSLKEKQAGAHDGEDAPTQ